MSVRPFLRLTALLLLILTGYLGYRITHDSGLLITLEPGFDGSCEVIDSVTGGEDISIDYSQGIAYISSDDRWATLAGKPRQGNIYGLAVNDRTAAPVNLTPQLSLNFHPHGISLFHAADGETRLLVVNHREDGTEWVEVFRVHGLQPLQHLKSITYPDLISPNDLVATGKSSFYVTSDHGFPRLHPMQMAEDYLTLALAKVTYYDGLRGQVVATGLRFANGINRSPDGKTLYVAEPVARRLQVYRIGDQPEQLQPIASVTVDSGLDNLEWGDDGHLWTGAHPKAFDFLAHMHNPEALSPSQVLRINPKDYRFTSVYLNDGTELSGSSAAAVMGKTLLIGPVYEHHLLRCQLP